jgi:hypothetical protein
MSNNTPLDPTEINVLGRFDLALSAILDDAHQHADQHYRNWAKLAATCVAVILAVAGGLAIDSSSDTPLAPVTKDMASALQAGVKVAQAFRN